jgi:hypothetical protein
MAIKTILDQEIEDEFAKLDEMKKGTDEYKTTVDGLTKLLDRHIEIEKQKTEAEVREEERKLKLKQMEDDKKDRWFKNGIAVAGIVIPSAITIWGTIKSIKFEQTGTITTIMGRGFISKLLPKK